MGAGALGSVVGGFMAKAGHAVTLVGRALHMDAIANGGLHITGIWGEHHVLHLATATGLDGLARGDFDVIVITVKSYDTAAAAAAIAPLCGDATLVCAYQNGLGNIETIAAAVGAARTVGVRAIYGTRVTQPGHVAVTVIASPTALGVIAPDAPADRVRALAEAMNGAGLPTVYSESIMTVLWAKVAYNSALNPLSALLDVPYGALPELTETRAMMDAAIDELYAVAQAMQVPLEPATAAAYRTLFYETLVPPTAAHYASMREDFLHRRRTEIDALNGAIVRFGESFGVPCPVNLMLTRLVKAREGFYGRPA